MSSHLDDDDDVFVPNIDSGPSFAQVVMHAIALPPKDRPAAKDKVLVRLALDNKLTAAAYAVALVILTDLMWERGASDRLGFADLMQRTERSRATIKRAVAMLEKHGHLVVDRRTVGPKLNAINRYSFPHFFS